jgi:type I restriction enzyme S subunit
MTRQFKIGDFLKRIKNQIDIDDSIKYKRVTVSGNHNGVSLRDEVLGSAIGTKKQFTIKSGNFILSKIDARNGAFGIIPDELDKAIITGNFWTYSVDTNFIDIEWFFYFTHSYNFIQICIESSTGSTHRKYMDEKVFLNHKIILPEIDEQKEMVKKYKTTSKISNSLTSEIQTQKQLLTQLKQSILQEAIQGKLTADWRASHPELVEGSNSAEALLKRIKAEKDQLIKDKKIKKEKALPSITAGDIPFELPPNGGWVWCRLGDIASNFDYGTSTKSTSSGKYPVLRMGNIQDGKIDWNNLKYTDNLNDFNQYQLYRGDLLFNRTNSREMVGKTALYDSDRYAIHAGYLVRVRLIEPTNEFYANTVLNSTLHREWCDSVKSDALGQSNINATKLKSFLFPLPPLEEQKAIVEKVETLMRKCDGLEQEIKSSEANAQMFMQAVLKEAFEGEKEVVEV